MPEFLWQNHGRGYHRPGQCAAARFVNSGDTDDTERAQFLFVTKTAAPVHANRRLSADLFCANGSSSRATSRDPDEVAFKLSPRSLDSARDDRKLFSNGGRFLAFAGAQVIQFGAAG